MKCQIYVLFSFVVSSVASSLSHPNVLLIVVDDLRPILGCYGDTLALTPNIDSLARHGTVFTRAFAQQALCGPSRTSFLTSRRPDTTKLYDVHFYWRKHAGIVSNYSDDQPYSWSEPAYHPPTQAHKQDPVCLGSDAALHTNIYCPVQVEQQPGRTLPDIETTEFATAWLQRWAAKGMTETKTAVKQPFFLAVGYHKPHIPLKFPWQFLDIYPIKSVPLAPNDRRPQGLPNVAWNPWNDLRYRDDIAALNVSFPFGPLPDYYARYIRQGYYAATTYTDALIGDLLSATNTLFPDTVVALVGDHGWSLGEHQEWSKFSNFEVATRVPFIISKLSLQTVHLFRGYNASLTELNKLKLSSMKEESFFPSGKRLLDLRIREKFKFITHKINISEKNLKRLHINDKFRSYNGLVELVDLFPTLVDMTGLPVLSPCPEKSGNVEVCTEGSSLAPIVNMLTNCKSSNVLMKSQCTSTNIQVKKAAFSQYPRPGPEPTLHPDSDQPPMHDTTIMGYSMRTNRYRYTAWLKFNNVTFKPDWSNIIAEELYDHKVDDEENHNVCRKRVYQSKKEQLQRKLRNGWKRPIFLT
nr:iduronate 2-sulfatase-like isoform X2 [Procambarus clarkii]